MPKLEIIKVGTKFNRLSYISDSKIINKRRFCVFKCECGTICEKSLVGVKNGSCKSCGCLNTEVRIMMCKNRAKHSLSSLNGVRNPIYDTLMNMIRRCGSEENKKSYKDKGISVCKEWVENPILFQEWAIKNGYRKGLQIDRINNDGNYEPNNCRFVTHSANNRNKSTNHIIVYNGVKYTLMELSELTGIKWQTLRGRLVNQKLSVEESVNKVKHSKNN